MYEKRITFCQIIQWPISFSIDDLNIVIIHSYSPHTQYIELRSRLILPSDALIL